MEPPTPRGLAGRLVGRVTGRVVDVVDPDLILEHVDINALMDRIDVNRLMTRIDVNALLARIDLEMALRRVDLDALLQEVDVESLVRRSGIPEVVADTTRHMAGSTLDLARRQVAGLDFVVATAALRALPGSATGPDGPSRLLAPRPGHDRRVITGHFAGPVARAAAFVIDTFVVTTLFTAGLAGIQYLAETLLDTRATNGMPEWMGAAALAGWAFLYSFASLAVTGRTVGKGVVGLRVVLAGGQPISRAAALVRTIAYPLSFALFGLGLAPIMVRRTRRALHDVLAGTAVVFDFGDRPAELPSPLSQFLDRTKPPSTGDSSELEA